MQKKSEFFYHPCFNPFKATPVITTCITKLLIRKLFEDCI